MKKSETNQKVNALFEDGQLPSLAYIFYQKSEDDFIVRPLHKHEDICEIILVCQGTCLYHQGEIPMEAKEGCVICTNQEELHELHPKNESSVSWYCIGLLNVRKKGLPKNHLLFSHESRILDSGDSRQLLEGLMRQIYQLTDKSDRTDLLVQMLTTSLVVAVDNVWQQQDSRSKKSEEKNISQRIVEYMNEHYQDENISLTEISQALNCSETHISHLFKKVTGQSPKQYIIRRRIGRAQTLLISTELSVTEIAATVGYNNTNYFSTLFADYTGITPMRYRKLYKEKVKGSYYQL